ncbi:MAG: hypothetical protein AAF850_08435 [Pseudomonadota bacterium]
MKVFFVSAEKRLSNLAARVEEIFGGNSRKLADSMWLVASDSTTQDLYRQIDLNGGDFGALVIVTLVDFFGWGDKSAWEWVEAKQNEDG